MAHSTTKGSLETKDETISVKKVVEHIEQMDIKEDEKKKFIAEITKKKSLCVMACGLTGAGKSSLLNGISGTDQFKAADLEPVTETVITKAVNKENHILLLCDTPGFEDDSNNEDRYLDEITKKCAGVDTLFYCIPVNVVRIKMKDDLATLQKLNSALEERIWRNCAIVLTFANTMVDRIAAGGITSPDKIKHEYKRRMEVWEEHVRATFNSAGIDPSKMPIVHAGISTSPFLLPTDEDPWLSTFFETVNTISPDDGESVLFGVNLSRLQLQYKQIPKNMPLYKQPLIVDKKPRLAKLKAKFPTIAAALATGGVSGVAGAGVGATIGALAIGIPTFGVAAGVGMLLGGLIGGATGVGVGAATGKIIEKVRDSK